MSILKNYLIVALRSIKRQKIYMAINVIGLAIGLLSCMIIIMWIEYHLSFDNFHKNIDRIYRPIMDVHVEGLNPNHHCGSTAIMGPVLTEELPGVENYVRLFWHEEHARLRYGETALSFSEYYSADPSLFDIFTFPFKFGDPNSALLEPNSLVLSEESAFALFGDENPVGHLVTMNGNTNYKVTGVLKKIPENSHLQFQVLTPFHESWINSHNKAHPYELDFRTYFLLSEGTEINRLVSRMDHFVKKYYPAVADGIDIYFQSLKNIHLYSAHITYNQHSYRSVDITYIYVFSAIALLILFIAAANYINLATARAGRRAKEVAIRKTTGAGRGQLIRQFLGESVLLALLALLIGYVLLELFLPYLIDLFGYELDFSFPKRFQLLGWMSIVAAAVGIFTGWYPALVLSVPNPQDAFNLTKKKGGLRKVLVVIQFSIAMILILFSITIEKQLEWIQNKNLGFNKEQTINFKMPDRIKQNFEIIKHNLLQNSWITGVSALGPVDFPGFQGKPFEFEGQPDDGFWATSCTAVDYNFVSFYGLTITEGRDFSRSRETDTREAYIINETLKKNLGWETAVGKRFRIPEYMDKPGRVIGVVKDFNWRSLHEGIGGCALFIKPEALAHMAIRITPDKTDILLNKMRDIWKSYAPDAGFQYHFLDDVYAGQYHSERKTRRIVMTFSILAIAIACLGLLGLISYTTEHRIKEIGIRKVLGASSRNILILLSKEFLIFLNVAVIIAAPLAWFLTKKWLDYFAYHIDVGIEIFFISWCVVFFIGFVTISWHALRSATANPVESIRYE